MNRFWVAILLSFFATVSWGYGLSPKAGKPSCKFPHKGDGGVLDNQQKYINDSVLVWVDVAMNCFDYVIDQRGNVALNDWIDASQKFNTAMENGNEQESFKMLNKANDSFKNVAPFIGKADLSMYFNKVYKEFGALVKAKNLNAINEYMICAYTHVKEKLGC